MIIKMDPLFDHTKYVYITELDDIDWFINVEPEYIITDIFVDVFRMML